MPHYIGLSDIGLTKNYRLPFSGLYINQPPLKKGSRNAVYGGGCDCYTKVEGVFPMHQLQGRRGRRGWMQIPQPSFLPDFLQPKFSWKGGGVAGDEKKQKKKIVIIATILL
jgi:hypothetical protein